MLIFPTVMFSVMLSVSTMVPLTMKLSIFAGMPVSTMMSFSVGMPVSMMVTVDIRIKGKIARKQCRHRFVRIAGHTTVKLYPCLRQCILRTHSDAAADQCIHFQIGKKACKGAVAASRRIYNLCACNHTVPGLINLKQSCVSEMLEYISVFVSNRNLHLYHTFLSCSGSFRRKSPMFSHL